MEVGRRMAGWVSRYVTYECKLRLYIHFFTIYTFDLTLIFNSHDNGNHNTDRSIDA